MKKNFWVWIAFILLFVLDCVWVLGKYVDAKFFVEEAEEADTLVDYVYGLLNEITLLLGVNLVMILVFIVLLKKRICQD